MATVPDLWEQCVIDVLRRKGFEVYLPFKDNGIDLLAVRDWQQGQPKRIQVKGSRTYPNPTTLLYPEACWHRLSKEKVTKGCDATDLFVLVWPRFGLHGRPEMQFLVVPTRDLIERLSDYQNGRWDMYISAGQRNGKWRVVDLRPSPGERLADILRGDGTLVNPHRDYTQYLNNWGALESAAV